MDNVSAELSRKARFPTPVFVRLPLMARVLLEPVGKMDVLTTVDPAELQLFSVGEVLSETVKAVELLFTVTFAPMPGTPFGDQLVAVFQELEPTDHADWANDAP
jgi:hypothetical protein